MNKRNMMQALIVLGCALAVSAQDHAPPFPDRVSARLRDLVLLSYSNSLPVYDFTAHTLITKESWHYDDVVDDVEGLYGTILQSGGANALVREYLKDYVDKNEKTVVLGPHTQRFRRLGFRYRLDLVKGFTELAGNSNRMTYVNMGSPESNDWRNFYVDYNWKSYNLRDSENGRPREVALWRAYGMHELPASSFLMLTADAGVVQRLFAKGAPLSMVKKNFVPDETKLSKLLRNENKNVRVSVRELPGGRETLALFDFVDPSKGSSGKLSSMAFVCDSEDYTRIYLSALLDTGGEITDGFALRSYDDSTGEVDYFAFFKRMNERRFKLRVAKMLTSRTNTIPDESVFALNVPKDWSLIDRRGDVLKEYRNGELIKSVHRDQANGEASAASGGSSKVLFFMMVVSSLLLGAILKLGLRRPA